MLGLDYTSTSPTACCARLAAKPCRRMGSTPARFVLEIRRNRDPIRRLGSYASLYSAAPMIVATEISTSAPIVV